MLDVHPPHHAVHAWRDFFIHIATISVGLLIAIGLEQSLEGMHHRHQRHILLESLQRDTELCVEDSRNATLVANQHRLWLGDRQKLVNTTFWGGPPLGVLLPEPPLSPVEFPSDPQWQAGKASGLLQLLSPEDTEAFSEVSSMIQLSNEARKGFDTAFSARRSFEHSFRSKDYQSLDLSKASAADLREYLRLLDQERNATSVLYGTALQTLGATSVVVKGERGLRKIQDAETQQMSTVATQSPR